MQDREQLFADLEKVDHVISRPFNNASMAAMIVALACQFLHIAFDIGLTVGFILMATSLSINLYGRFISLRSKKELFVRHGLMCQKCKKTPNPAVFSRGFPHAWCSHCMCKY